MGPCSTSRLSGEIHKEDPTIDATATEPVKTHYYSPKVKASKGATDFIVRLLLAVWIKYSLLVELLAALSVSFQD